MSYIEKTARKLHPILIELKKRMIAEKPTEQNDCIDNEVIVDLKSSHSTSKIDLKSILGYLNQGEWTNKLSLGSIMQL